uniref:WRKY transcription factor n=1 Tax=Fagopyrum tataricum TaxID=62330 RepID=A0A4P9Q342_FAGTA|nr:WRKY transcription factor [Fagopyrum tataricum]
MPHQGSSSTWANHDQHTSNFELSQARKEVKLDKPKDDGHNWRKYGQKPTKDGIYSRSYYKCTHRDCHPVRKRVQHAVAGHITEVIYTGHHNHPPSRLVQRDTSTQKREIIDSVDTYTTFEKEEEENVASAQGTFEVVMSNGRVMEAKIVVQTKSDINVLDDGYRWHKYGQKAVKGNPNPR